jgi:hypothetical protein
MFYSVSKSKGILKNIITGAKIPGFTLNWNKKTVPKRNTVDSLIINRRQI